MMSRIDSRHWKISTGQPFSKWPPQYYTNSTLSDFKAISYVGRLWCPKLIPDIEKFLPVAIFKMATTIPHKFNIVQSCRNIFPVCQTIGLADVDNVRPIKHLPDLHIFYNFNWITHILVKSIKWFVYSFKWYLGILKVSTTHFCVTCGNIHTIQ
jgi:hypothetical protein